MHRKRRLSPLLALVVLLGLEVTPGCSASVKEPNPPKSQPRAGDAGPPFESPAHWVAFPQSVGAAQSTLTLEDGRCLVTTDDGQRWVVSPRDKAHPCSGPGIASGSPTYEPLVGAQRLGPEFRFVAEGGAVYTSREANGPFTRYVKAPKYLRHVTARGSAIVGLDEAGGTYFYDGAAWKTAAVPKGARGIDVAADDQGRVLWLGAPESILLSTDAGRTFQAPRTATAPFGAHEAGFTKSGKLAAKGALGDVVWEGDSLSPTKEKITEVNVPEVEIDPAVGPRATAVVEQRAALDGTRYFEMTEPLENARHGLAKASLGKAIEKIPLEELEACDAVKVAAASGLIAFACTKEVPDQISLSAELWTSKNAGETLERVATLTTPSFSDLSFSLANDGSMLVLGACKAAAPKAEGNGGKDDKPADDGLTGPCNPKGPLYVHAGNVTAGTVPYLEEASGRSPLLAPDGRTAYFLGRSRKDSMHAVFVSRDGGRSYQMRTIEPPQSSSWGEEEEPDAESGYVRPLYLSETSTLTIDETGTLGVVGERDVGLAWITLDADGRIANVGEPPEPSFMVGGVGGRVLALGYGQMDGVLRSWESLDGGITWGEITTTPAVQRYGERGGSFVCAQGGCLLGDELARIGWEGQSETPFTMGEELFPNGPEPKLGIPLACQLVSKSEWTPIEGRAEERPSGSGYISYGSGPGFPRMREIVRGKTLWSVATTAEDGRVDITAATLPDKDGVAPTVSKKSLLPAAKGGKNGAVATTVRARPEGYVALRATIPLAKSGGFDTSKKMENLEVAWQNQYAGAIAKKSVSFDTVWNPSIATGAQLKPSLLTIAMSGAVIQPFVSSKATYVDGQGSVPFDYPNMVGLVTDGRPVGFADATHVGGRPYALVVADRAPTGQVVVTAPANVAAKGKAAKVDASTSPNAFTIAPATAEVERLYAGDRPGFVALLTSTDDATPPSALGFTLEADGKLSGPIDLPTLADLADRPQPCTAEDRKTTPRTVSPHFGKFGALLFENGRRAVMIADSPTSGPGTGFGAPAMEPTWLLTDGAILHGTKKDPCLAAWRASGTRPGFVAVIGGNPEHSFLLRSTSAMKPPPKGVTTSGRWVQQLEARPMTCRYQPDLAVPFEVIARSHQRMSDDQP